MKKKKTNVEEVNKGNLGIFKKLLDAEEVNFLSIGCHGELFSSLSTFYCWLLAFSLTRERGKKEMAGR